jgi:general secretion pathway protein K
MVACGTRHQQQGLALITAVLVVAIVATVATTLALGEQVWFRQAQNMTNRAQAESLRAGALNFAAILLTREGNKNKTDDLTEDWAKPLSPIPVEDGMLAFKKVEDEQSRFNLNNLVRASANFKANYDMFQRLLTALEIDTGLSETLSDWIDSDFTVGQGVAEDIEYLSLPQPYRTANQLLTSVDELRLVKGFTAKNVEKLRPYVTALPVSTPVNVNTAPDQVLAALLNLQVSALRPVLEGRPFADTAKFLAQLPAGTTCPANLCDVKTGYFLVTIDILYGRLLRHTEALIQRPANGPATVLWHRQPPLQFDTKLDEKT